MLEVPQRQDVAGSVLLGETCCKKQYHPGIWREVGFDQGVPFPVPCPWERM